MPNSGAKRLINKQNFFQNSEPFCKCFAANSVRTFWRFWLVEGFISDHSSMNTIFTQYPSNSLRINFFLCKGYATCSQRHNTLLWIIFNLSHNPSFVISCSIFCALPHSASKPLFLFVPFNYTLKSIMASLDNIGPIYLSDFPLLKW
jgi:hypothetical protein